MPVENLFSMGKEGDNPPAYPSISFVRFRGQKSIILALFLCILLRFEWLFAGGTAVEKNICSCRKQGAAPLRLSHSARGSRAARAVPPSARARRAPDRQSESQRHSGAGSVMPLQGLVMPPLSGAVMTVAPDRLRLLKQKNALQNLLRQAFFGSTGTFLSE